MLELNTVVSYSQGEMCVLRHCHLSVLMDAGLPLRGNLGVTLTQGGVSTVPGTNGNEEIGPGLLTTAVSIVHSEHPSGGAHLARNHHGTRDRKSTRLNSSHLCASRMPSSA